MTWRHLQPLADFDEVRFREQIGERGQKPVGSHLA
jgi:hypothetical protein